MTAHGAPSMTAHGFALFDTPIGRCGIAWGERGITGVQLPEAREPETRARLGRRFPGAREALPPRDVQRAQAAIVALLRGETRDLSKIALDMEQMPPFQRRVYETARTIPAGTTLAYGEIARRIGSPDSARAVGQALGRNPFAIIVPCHRVLAAGGKVGGFTANGGVTTKLRLLTLEGADASRLPGARRTEGTTASASIPSWPSRTCARPIRRSRASSTPSGRSACSSRRRRVSSSRSPKPSSISS